jgi:hypothetical protein
MKIAKPLFACLLLALASVAWADARYELSIRKEQDAEQNTIHVLTNTGAQRIKATVEIKTECSGQSNRDEPQQRVFWVEPNATVKIDRSAKNSACTRSFRIVQAEYA